MNINHNSIAPRGTTKKNAQRLGFPFYWAADRCVNNHDSPRNSKHGYCVACHQQRAKDQQQRQRPVVARAVVVKPVPVSYTVSLTVANSDMEQLLRIYQRQLLAYYQQQKAPVVAGAVG